MSKKYISKVKLPNIDDPYDITLPSDASITISAVTANTITASAGNITTVYSASNINVAGATLSLPTTSGTLALKSDIPEDSFYYDEL